MDLILATRLNESTLNEAITDSFGVAATFSDHRLWQCSGKTQITNFDVALIIDQDISWFDISVHDISTVKEFDSTNQVVNHKLDVVLAKLCFV